MKTLVIFGHNDINRSTYSKTILEELRQHPRQDVTVKVLSEEYMNYKIDVEAEKKSLLENDRIVFVFPVEWYGVPSLLKKWEEDVLLHGFAFGEGGDKLKGKQTFFIATTNGSAEAYSATGYNNYPVIDFFKPFEQTFRLCSMDVRMPMFYQDVYGVGRGIVAKTEEDKKANEESLKKLAKEAYTYITQENVPAWEIRGLDLKPKLV